MRNFQKKNNISRFLHSTPFLLVLGVVAIFFAYNMIGLVGKMRETVRNKQIAEEKVSELQKSKESLSLDIAKLNTKQGLEEDIRERFGLVKEGESVIVIVEDKNETEVDAKANSGGFFSFLKNLFK
ncbi:septum formation initiator family protein [Candidatus Nomurabacteria bacterium]|nr:septum formation initiator family protein [Candidatus Nomurabacteria bacterium]